MELTKTEKEFLKNKMKKMYNGRYDYPKSKNVKGILTSKKILYDNNLYKVGKVYGKLKKRSGKWQNLYEIKGLKFKDGDKMLLGTNHVESRLVGRKK